MVITREQIRRKTLNDMRVAISAIEAPTNAAVRNIVQKSGNVNRGLKFIDSDSVDLRTEICCSCCL